MDKSISEILNKAINDALDDGIDLSTSAQRNELRKKFLKDHPHLKIHRTTFVKAFKQVFEERKIDLISVKLTRKKRYDVEFARQLQEQNKALEVKQTAQEPQVQPVTQQTDYEIIANTVNDEVWPKESICAFWRCLTTPLTMGNPDIQLSEDTISALADMYYPGFNRYGGQKMRDLALLTLGTVCVLGTHLYRGYQSHQKAELEKKKLY